MNSWHHTDTWGKFLEQRERLPSWKIPLNIAVALHLAVFAGAAVLPDFKKKYEQDDVITIDLLSLPPTAPAPAAVQQVKQTTSTAAQQAVMPPQPERVQVAEEKAEAKEIQEERTAELSPPESAPAVAERVAELPVLVPKKVVRKAAPRPEPVAEIKAVSPHPVKRRKKLTEDIRPVEKKNKEAKKDIVAVQKNAVKKESASESAAQVRSVSLRPLKRKKKLVKDTRLAEEKEREKGKRKQAQEHLAALKKQALDEQRKLAEKKKREKRKQVQERLAVLKKQRLDEQREREQRQLERAKIAEQKRIQAEKKLAARKKRQQEAEAKKRRAEEQRRQREIAEAARLVEEAEQAAVQARLEAALVRNEHASVARATAELNTPLLADNAGPFSGGRGDSGNRVYGGYGTEQVNSVALQQYTRSLKGRVSSYWQLPEIVNKKSNLSTMVALTVHRDGTIEDMWIERSSGDNFFDQSVIKALRNSAPLPGFPSLINKPTLEFALNFTPQGLTL